MARLFGIHQHNTSFFKVFLIKYCYSHVLFMEEIREPMMLKGLSNFKKPLKIGTLIKKLKFSFTGFGKLTLISKKRVIQVFTGNVKIDLACVLCSMVLVFFDEIRKNHAVTASHKGQSR